jgi:Flp pilus assembly pilin Flp
MFFYRLSLGRKERGQGLVEYSLILLLIAMAVFVSLVFFGQSVRDTYCQIIIGLAPLTDPSEACSQPMITLRPHSQGPNHLNLEAEINNPDGDPDDPYGAIERVEFYIDDTNGSPVQTEYHFRYCLSGNHSGDPCHNFDTSVLAPGDHTFIVIVYDTDGNTSTSTYRYHR